MTYEPEVNRREADLLADSRLLGIPSALPSNQAARRIPEV
jgi:hypothetical protein